MRRTSFRRTLLAAIIACGVLVFPASSGAVTIGSNCGANSSNNPLFFTTSTSSGESYVVPFDGILTSWGANRTGQPGLSLLAAILVDRPGPQWVVAAATPWEFIKTNAGQVSFPARIAVSAGQLLGSSTPAGVANAYVCLTGSGGDVSDNFAATLGVGDSFTPNPDTGKKASIWATIEKDGDGDGYGDETQDKCPQSADFQIACPVLSISQLLTADAKQITVLASATVNTSITATAAIKLGKKTVTIKGKPKAFIAGKFTKVKLKLPANVKSAVKSGKKLPATVTLTGSGLANAATSSAKITLKRR